MVESSSSTLEGAKLSDKKSFWRGRWVVKVGADVPWDHKRKGWSETGIDRKMATKKTKTKKGPRNIVVSSMWRVCTARQPRKKKSSGKSIGMCLESLGSGIRNNKEKALIYPNNVLRALVRSHRILKGVIYCNVCVCECVWGRSVSVHTNTNQYRPSLQRHRTLWRVGGVCECVCNRV